MKISARSEHLIREYGRAERNVGVADCSGTGLAIQLEMGDKRRIARESLKRRVARLEAEIRRLKNVIKNVFPAEMDAFSTWLTERRKERKRTINTPPDLRHLKPK